MEERILSAEDTIKEIDSSVKDNIKSNKKLNPKYPGNLGHHEKTKPKNNRYRREEGSKAQKIYSTKSKEKTFPT